MTMSMSMKTRDRFLSNMDKLLIRINDVVKQDRYQYLKLKYEYETDEQQKKIYKRHLDSLAKSIIDKKAIWL